MGYLLLFPGCPCSLYDSGIRYVEEPPGRDDWQDIAETLERQEGDCEDLACWRVAELRVRLGERAATHVVTVQDLPDPRTGDVVTTYHIAVRRADGRLEDPSRLLGMKG